MTELPEIYKRITTFLDGQGIDDVIASVDMSINFHGVTISVDETYKITVISHGGAIRVFSKMDDECINYIKRYALRKRRR